MIKDNDKPNPKALKLEGLENLNRKVTIGFKCHPQIKLHLAAEAKKSGLTLSEFIEILIQELDSAVNLEKEEVQKLQQQLAYYENEVLLEWFKHHENQNIKYTNSKGEIVSITIKQPRDIYTILINSFKLKK